MIHHTNVPRYDFKSFTSIVPKLHPTSRPEISNTKYFPTPSPKSGCSESSASSRDGTSKSTAGSKHDGRQLRQNILPFRTHGPMLAFSPSKPRERQEDEGAPQLRGRPQTSVPEQRRLLLGRRYMHQPDGRRRKELPGRQHGQGFRGRTPDTRMCWPPPGRQQVLVPYAVQISAPVATLPLQRGRRKEYPGCTPANVQAQVHHSQAALYDAFRKLLERPYVKRVGIYQGLHFGRNIHICCRGENAGLSLLWGLYLAFPSWISHSGKLLSVINLDYFVSGEANITFLLEAGVMPRTRVSLLETMCVVGMMQSKDHRDRVFGALAMIDWKGRKPIQPDYGKDPFDLAVEVLQKIGQCRRLYNVDRVLHYTIMIAQLLGLPDHPSSRLIDEIQKRRSNHFKALPAGWEEIVEKLDLMLSEFHAKRICFFNVSWQIQPCPLKYAVDRRAFDPWSLTHLFHAIPPPNIPPNIQKMVQRIQLGPVEYLQTYFCHKRHNHKTGYWYLPSHTLAKDFMWHSSPGKLPRWRPSASACGQGSHFCPQGSVDGINIGGRGLQVRSIS